MPEAMNRVFLLDAGLRHRAGHHYQMARGIHATLAELGVPCVIHAHAEVAAEVRAELGAAPSFSRYHYEFPYGDPYCKYLEYLMEGGGEFANELVQCLGDSVTGDDLLFLPTAGPRELAGVSLWIKRRKVVPRVAALFHGIVLPHAAVSAGSAGGAVIRYVGRMLGRNPGPEHLMLGTTTNAMKRRLEDPLGHEMRVFPAPVWYPGAEDLGAPPVPTESDPPVVAFIGQMRESHGHAVIPDVVRALKKSKLPFRCVIHLGAVDDDLDLAPYRELERAGHATLLAGWQDDAVMTELLRGASAVVLPYARDTFSARLSAAMCTAIGYGRPCVVPSGTWLSARIEHGNAAGVVYEGDGADAIADAVGALLEQRDHHVRRAMELAPNWRRDQSGPALVRGLVKWMQSAPAAA